MADALRRFTPLVSLLVATVLWLALDAWLWGAPFAGVFLLSLFWETPYRRKRYLALAAPLLLLAFAPIATDTSWRGFLLLGGSFTLALVVPTLLLRGEANPVTFAFWPERPEPLEVFYTLLAAPLAWGALTLYFGVFSPEVPFNWTLPPEPDSRELLRLFIGINSGRHLGRALFYQHRVRGVAAAFRAAHSKLGAGGGLHRLSCGRWPFAGSARSSSTFLH